MESNYKFVTELTEQKVADLKSILSGQGNARNKKRAQAISLSARKYTIQEISAILECHRVTVSRWINQWHEQGLDGLLEREGRGRKKSLSEAEEKQVLEWLKSGERSINGLLGKIEKIVKKKISPATLKRLFKHSGKIWKRIRASLAGKRNEEEFHQCEQALIEYMEAAVRDELDVLYLDQSGCGRAPYIPYAWQDKGSTIEVPCREGKRINVMGLYSLMKGTLHADITDKNITSAVVVDFLENLSKSVAKPTVVVLDNASIYTAKVVSEKLHAWEDRNLYLYYLPTYSPELNFIEIVWRKIKYGWLPLSAYESFKSLQYHLKNMIPKIGIEYNIYFA